MYLGRWDSRRWLFLLGAAIGGAAVGVIMYNITGMLWFALVMSFLYAAAMVSIGDA
jgi:hypothetical protein